MKHITVLTAAGLALTPPAAVPAAPAAMSVKLQMREGRPVVDGVIVSGHGPFCFPVDTGATFNTIDPKLAQSVGLVVSFQTRLTSSTSVTTVSGSEVARCSSAE